MRISTQVVIALILIAATANGQKSATALDMNDLTRIRREMNLIADQYNSYLGMGLTT